VDAPEPLWRLEHAVEARAQEGRIVIPPYPAVALRVQEAMGRKTFSLGEAATLIGADAALAADILRCANSAMYRRGAVVVDLTQALTRIGEQQVMRLLLASGLAVHANAVGPLVLLRRMVWIEGLAGAALCQELARLRGQRTEEAFTVGLLHDFGKIAAIATLEAVIDEEKVTESFSQSAWVELVDRLHLRVGAALAVKWGLPPLVAEVIAHHHGGGACQDPRLLEVVRLSDAIVGLLLMRARVEGQDLAAVPGVAAAERDPVARVIEQIPDFVASFETPAATAHVAQQRVVQPETTLPPGGRAVKFGLSVSVAKRPRMFTAVAIGPDGLVVQGDEPIPVNRLLEAKLYGEQPFAVWVRSRLCRAEGGGFRAELSPFALTGELRVLWDKLVAGAK
jgi:HD-like signal output (HDOD) protein